MLKSVSQLTEVGAVTVESKKDVTWRLFEADAVWVLVGKHWVWIFKMGSFSVLFLDLFQICGSSMLLLRYCDTQ